MNESISRLSKVVSGVSGTGIEFGTITVFGSTFVNGVEYELDTANIFINDAPVTEAVKLSHIKSGPFSTH